MEYFIEEYKNKGIGKILELRAEEKNVWQNGTRGIYPENIDMIIIPFWNKTQINEELEKHQKDDSAAEYLYSQEEDSDDHSSWLDQIHKIDESEVFMINKLETIGWDSFIKKVKVVKFNEAGMKKIAERKRNLQQSLSEETEINYKIYSCRAWFNPETKEFEPKLTKSDIIWSWGKIYAPFNPFIKLQPYD